MLLKCYRNTKIKTLLLKHLQRFHIRIMCSSSPFCNYVFRATWSLFISFRLLLNLWGYFEIYRARYISIEHVQERCSHATRTSCQLSRGLAIHGDYCIPLFAFRFCTILWLNSVFNPILTAFTFFFSHSEYSDVSKVSVGWLKIKSGSRCYKMKKEAIYNNKKMLRTCEDTHSHYGYIQYNVHKLIYRFRAMGEWKKL